MPSRIPIVIADDHAVLRESLVALLKSQPDFDIVGAAATGDEALRLVDQCRPRVLVLDLFMPQQDGFGVLRSLDRIGEQVASVVLTGSDSVNDHAQVVRLGARGLVLKGDQPDRLFSAIRTVAGGELAFSEDVAEGVRNAMSVDPQPETAASLDRLSRREWDIARQVARGMKNRDIARTLEISENTVKRHLQSIFSKSGARDRLELAMLMLSESRKAA